VHGYQLPSHHFGVWLHCATNTGDVSMKLWPFTKTSGTPLTPRQKQEQELFKSLPDGMEGRLKALSDDDFKSYHQMFSKRGTSISDGYFYWFLAALHYPYILGGKGMFIWLIFIIVSFYTFGIVGILWWIMDFFRIPSMVRDNNREIALKTLQDIQLLSVPVRS
jgi:hypothetical protein